MKPYPEYKDSGIDWIGNIPKDWGLKKIKHGSYVKGRIGWKGLKSDEFLTEGYAFLVTGTDFHYGIIDWETCYHIDQFRYDEDPYIQLRENDLLITKDGTIGKVAIVKGLNGYACLNSGIFLVRPINGIYETEFLYWMLNSNVFNEFINFIRTGSTISHLYQNVFVEFIFPVPPRKEREAIVNFLDHR
jgi:type I restriction enzyme S subunit